MENRIRLTDHFFLDEFEKSEKAVELKINNSIPPNLQRSILRLAQAAEEIRGRLGGATMLISSGYRCITLNRAIGSSDKSAHTRGLAIDFIAPKFGTPYQICMALAKDPTIEFDQLIYEGTWVHFSIDPRMRRELLTKPKGHGDDYIRGIKGDAV